jgi:hypothetical protein
MSIRSFDSTGREISGRRRELLVGPPGRTRTWLVPEEILKKDGKLGIWPGRPMRQTCLWGPK